MRFLGKFSFSLKKFKNLLQIQFSCDHVFNEQSSQEEVFNKITPELFQSFVDGENVCIFAYGQTGSGKTYRFL